MQFTLEYPVAARTFAAEFTTQEGLTRFAQAAEALGYSAIGFTDHPAPSRKWLDNGGHQNLDPIAAMAFCAAVTTTLEVMPFLLVLPYRNPLLSAKALATVDLISNGRVIAVCGAGYLRSEFRALGVQFDERNELLDDGLAAMRAAWSQERFDYSGRHFVAAGISMLPRPARPGGPPVWIGGNSPLARRRAAGMQGWSPMMSRPEVVRTARTTPISDVAELARSIREVRDTAQRQRGPEASVSVQVLSPQSRWMVDDRRVSAEEHRDHLGQLSQAGVDRIVLKPPTASLDASLDALGEYADSFISGQW